MTVKGDGADRQLTVMLKDYQTDTLTRTVVHADFVRVDLTKEIHVDHAEDLVQDAADLDALGLAQEHERHGDVGADVPQPGPLEEG